MPVLRGDMRRAFRLNELYTVLIAVLTAAGALLGGYKMFVSEARAAGAEEAKSVADRISKVEKAQERLEKSQDEVREDIRSLYRATLYRQPQERLEKPAPVRDAGP